MGSFLSFAIDGNAKDIQKHDSVQPVRLVHMNQYQSMELPILSLKPRKVLLRTLSGVSEHSPMDLDREIIVRLKCDKGLVRLFHHILYRLYTKKGNSHSSLNSHTDDYNHEVYSPLIAQGTLYQMYNNHERARLKKWLEYSSLYRFTAIPASSSWPSERGSQDNWSCIWIDDKTKFFWCATSSLSRLNSKLVYRLLRVSRSSYYLETFDNREACMLSAVHENAGTQYLYMGERDVID